MKAPYLFFLLILTPGLASFGQSKKYTQVFQEYYDNKPIHFGFQFGFSSGRYFISQAGSFKEVTSPSDFGFFVGGTANYSFNQYLEIKSGLNVALYSRELKWGTDQKVRESTWLEIPMLMKFRSLRRKNHRAFLIAGTKLSWESNKRASTNLMGKQYDVTLEYGFGFERFNKYFKFSPEIRFSNGLINLYSLTPGVPFDPNLKTNTISIILNFE